MTLRGLILRHLGLQSTDPRLPVHRAENKQFVDYAGYVWTLHYGQGSVMLHCKERNVRLQAEHLSDLIVFYSVEEFVLYIKALQK